MNLKIESTASRMCSESATVRVARLAVSLALVAGVAGLTGCATTGGDVDAGNAIVDNMAGS